VRQKIYRAEADGSGVAEALGVIAMIIGALDVAGCLCLVVLSLLATSDPAAAGLGIRLVWLVLALYAATGLPGLVLACLGRTPRTALALAGAFPAGFMVMYGAFVAYAAA
jgi:hypothetical protein